ncbi:MAG TPA: hypothetical protein V6C81_28650 [Planktothrix sp.]|jgi:hypothetical protein
MTQIQNSQLPLSNAAYDLIAMLHEKSKVVQAYERYLDDVQHDTQLRNLLIEIRHDEQRHIEKLMGHLPRLLTAVEPKEGKVEAR